MVVAPNGDLIMAGNLNGESADISGSSIKAGLFVSKSSSAGKHVWTKAVTKRFVDSLNVGSIAVSASGDIAVTGSFSQPELDFGGGALLKQLGTQANMFVVVFDSAGRHRWSRRFGQQSIHYSSVEMKGVTVDGKGNVTVYGRFSGWLEIWGKKLQSKSYDWAWFSAHFDASGKTQWARVLADMSSYATTPSFEKIAVDTHGNPLLIGNFTGLLEKLGTTPLKAAGGNDIVLVKLSKTDGSLLWSKSFGSVDDDYGYALQVAANGDILLGGSFSGRLDLGGGVLLSVGRQDMLAVRLTADGKHLWSKRWGGTSDDRINDLWVDAAGGLIIAGDISGRVDLGGGALLSAGGHDAVVAQFDASGQHLWSRNFGGSGNDSATHVGIRGKELTLMGAFFKTADFRHRELTSAGDRDLFQIRLTTK
jgi:hypothetical protein